jgi:PKD repeat protein
MRSPSWSWIAAAAALATAAWTPNAQAAKPDLVVRAVEAAPTTVAAGRTITVTDTTANVGRKRAGASWTAYALIGWRPKVELGGRPVPALASGEESRGSVAVTVPAATRDGAYALIACADARRGVRESREYGNCRIARPRVVIDSAAPAAPAVGERPDAATNRTTVRIAFSHPERGVTFACRLDGGAEQPCTSPYEAAGLAEGGHRFEVWAIDAAGNRGPAAVVEWTVDLSPPPAPLIDERPAQVTTATTARFAFHDDEAGAGLRCALDDAEPAACQSPVEYTGLAQEEHEFAVLAVDAAGNQSAPVGVRWTVVPEQATLGDGAWSWFGDPRAVRFNGVHRRTYVGWTSGDGSIEVAAFDHDSLVRTTAWVGKEQKDDHNNPSIQILPDRRVRVYWSMHGGPELWYRTSLAPEDITAWGPPQRVGTTTPGEHGYSYPNPVHLDAEGATYLFWRGGNWNPTFSVQADGQDTWRPAANVVYLDGQRPYMKVASNGVDKIAFAYTDAHPAELEDVNIHYAEYRAGADAGLYTAGGRRIGALGDPVPPTAGDMVYDPPYKTWIHDVALDADGRPVLVFAGFPSEDDHRYFYARWTGTAWDVHEMVAAGGSIQQEPSQPYYSGGLTLDHESPDTVYLSRDVNGVFEIETWRTPDGGASWTSTAVTAASRENNVRPVSPRGLIPFSADFGVIWMRGAYPHYLRYQTSIATILATGGNLAPVANVTLTPPSGSGPLTVVLDASASSDEDGRVTSYQWDFGDGTAGTGARVTHRFRTPGSYFARVTVTDDSGASDVYVAEVVVGPWQPVEVIPGPAWTEQDGAVTLSGMVNGHNQETTYHFEYGTGALDQRTPDARLEELNHADQFVTARVEGAAEGATYRYRLVATNETGTATTAERTMTVAAPSGSAYRTAVLTTPGVLGYWRLGEATGTAAADELGANAGTYSALGVTLAQPGALTGDADTSAGFDGVAGEMTATTASLSAQGTLEGWFDWRAGTALMRDNTTSGGWILIYDDTTRTMRTRVAGASYTTDLPSSSFQDGWHHFAVTKDGSDVRLYVDAKRLPLRLTSAGTFAASAGAWHIMRNGRSITNAYAQGRADEVAVYGTALTLADIQRHYMLGRG